MITTRRMFLSTGAAALGGLGRGTAALLSVPTVDSLTLHVVTDNATFGPFLPDQSLPGLKVLRGPGTSPSGVMPSNPLLAEFGLSVLAESKVGAETKKVLVDFGYSAGVLRNNLSLLGIDPLTIDAAVLSHGHLDHYGGFSGLFAKNAAPRRKIPLFVGGEEVFCERLALIGNPPPKMGTLNRTQLASAGFEVRVEAAPTLVAANTGGEGRNVGHAFTTGVIPLATFERAAIPTQMHPGVGCDITLLSEAKRKEELISDDGEHELATCYAVKDLGLVVIASCSHRGVLNSIRRAQEVSGISKLHAVIGGFHLVRPRTEAEAKRTVTELAAFDPAYVIPMHCTGEVFIEEALRVMPRKLVRPYVGTRFVMGA